MNNTDEMKVNKTNILILLLLFFQIAHSQNPTEEELVNLHDVSTVDMNAISNPVAGSLIYNIDEKSVFVFDGVIWKNHLSDGTETMIEGNGGITVTGTGEASSAYEINVMKPTLVDNGDNSFTFSNGIDTDVTFGTASTPEVVINGSSSGLYCDAAVPNSTTDITITGGNFTNLSVITIPNQIVNSINFVSATQIIVNVTASSVGGSYDVTITNEYGTDTFIDGFYIKTTSEYTIAVSEMILSNQMTYDGNTIKKTGGARVFQNHQGYTITYAIPSNQEGYVEYTPTGSTATNRFMVGLDPDPAVDADWTQMDYAVYVQDPGNLKVYEGGALKGQYGNQSVGDVIRINVDCDGEVTYLKNGTVFYTSTVSATGKTLYFDSTFKNTGSEFSNIKIVY